MDLEAVFRILLKQYPLGRTFSAHGTSEKTRNQSKPLGRQTPRRASRCRGHFLSQHPHNVAQPPRQNKFASCVEARESASVLLALFASPILEPLALEMAEHEIDVGDHVVPPEWTQSKLKACMSCSLIKTIQQFVQDGCDNCPFMSYEGDRERVTACTTSQFVGYVTTGLSGSSPFPTKCRVSSWIHGC